MALKRKHRRLGFVVASMVCLMIATGLVLNAAEQSLMFFYLPSDLADQSIPEGREFRLGGLVEEGSIKHLDQGQVISFNVTDLAASVPVTFRGSTPELFAEGVGVVSEGKMAGGIFIADVVLAKHDENFMSAEVADALKEAGLWQDHVNN